jgi:hypothetical protein
MVRYEETLLSMLPFATLVSESRLSTNDLLDYCSCVTPTFYKNTIFVHIGVHIKMHIKL